MMRGNHGGDIETFAQEAWSLWAPFMIGVLEASMVGASEEVSKGLVTLKIQAIRVCSI
jgi:hypothetical protein